MFRLYLYPRWLLGRCQGQLLSYQRVEEKSASRKDKVELLIPSRASDDDLHCRGGFKRMGDEVDGPCESNEGLLPFEFMVLSNARVCPAARYPRALAC